jgi:hypothetical protein
MVVVISLRSYDTLFKRAGIRHSRGYGNSEKSTPWIPAFAGMTASMTAFSGLRQNTVVPAKAGTQFVRQTIRIHG